MKNVNQNGFTLIELLIVIAILIALSAFGYYNFTKDTPPEDIIRSLADPRSAATKQCTAQCQSLYGNDSLAKQACESACSSALQ